MNVMFYIDRNSFYSHICLLEKYICMYPPPLEEFFDNSFAEISSKHINISVELKFYLKIWLKSPLEVAAVP